MLSKLNIHKHLICHIFMQIFDSSNMLFMNLLNQFNFRQVCVYKYNYVSTILLFKFYHSLCLFTANGQYNIDPYSYNILSYVQESNGSDNIPKEDCEQSNK